jgi:hypothetical protein
MSTQSELFFAESDLAVKLESALQQIKNKDEKIKFYEEEIFYTQET